MKPIKLKNEKVLKGIYTPKGKVWYQHNEDFAKIKQEQIKADKNITSITKSNFKNQKTRRY